MNNLEKGSFVRIESYKHNGTIHRIWKKNMILNASNTHMIGVNDHTKVIEKDGSSWVTKEPAVFYFARNWWFNIIGLLRQDGVHYYCNMSSPYIFQDQAIKYIDYDLDMKVYPDMSYHILDRVEFHLNKKRMNYPRDLDNILYDQLDHLVSLIQKRKEPFSFSDVEHWYEQYLMYQSQFK